MVLIGGATGKDAILFVKDLVDGYIFDENSEHVPLTYSFPKLINQIPRVAMIAQPETMKFISIPAVRRRWTATFNLTVFAITADQRYAIKQSLQKRLDALSYPTQQLADNYVYMWYTTHDYPDDVKMFGQPIFKVGFVVTLVYDVVISLVATPPPPLPNEGAFEPLAFDESFDI
jgi:hypothetical protein